MARLPRLVLAGHVHLILHAGNIAQHVFADVVDRDSYLECLRDAARAAGVAIHAYGLHPGEARLLATPETESSLAQMMQSVGRRFVPLFNARHGRGGSPWAGRFRSVVIESAPHLLACIRFVEGLGTPPASSPKQDERQSSSSAQHHLRGTPDRLLTEHAGFWALGNTPFEREAAYRAFVTQPAHGHELAAILLAVRSGWPLGSDGFADAVGRQSGRRVRPAPRGRPKNTVKQIEA